MFKISEADLMSKNNNSFNIIEQTGNIAQKIAYDFQYLGTIQMLFLAHNLILNIYNLF